MIELLGFFTAAITLVAALFGLIPPLLSSSGRNGSLSDRSASEIIEAVKPFVVIGGIMALYFFFMFASTSFLKFQREERGEEEAVEIFGVTDSDRNLVTSAVLLLSHRSRTEALIEIVGVALAQENLPLAILAASEIMEPNVKNEQLEFIRRAMIEASTPDPAPTDQLRNGMEHP